jgi:NAD(P)-dependent dehydrogenase (short-subunit alcohol dehydrogenase family)
VQDPAARVSERAALHRRMRNVRPQHAGVLINADPNHEALSAFQPIERMGETSDIANAMLFLDSAPFITGEILHVDGGQAPAAEMRHHLGGRK